MFEAHGFFDVHISGQILVADIKGGWNIETALAYKAVVEKISRPLIGKPWAMLSLMDDWELFTPDCKPIILKLTYSALQNGFVRDAMVDKSGSIKMQSFPSSIETHPQFKRQFFENREPAMSWLKSEGFEP